MTFPKILLIASVIGFAAIGAAAWMKKGKASAPQIALAQAQASAAPIVKQAPPMAPALPHPSAPVGTAPIEIKDDFPEVDRVHQLFIVEGNKLPIVETITYSSTVPWLKGRPAWLADYAAYHSTSRHFIARSLNGKPDYLSQKVFPGNRFNVFRNDKHVTFYLLVDVKRCKMGFYYIDLDTSERVLLKTYRIGLGRLDSRKPSGCLTPLGKYTLGNKIATYKPGIMGHFQDKKVEMISVFGTRWIPFDQEVGDSGSNVKGYGIQGVPWRPEKSGQLAEDESSIGKYESDGCIRLSQKDMEELFAIVVSKPAIVEIVPDFRQVKLPGTEVALPSR